MTVSTNDFSRILKTSFVVGMALYFVFFNMEKPRILILHSYATDYSWVRNLNDGLTRVFGNRTDFSTHWQYMNTKNHPSIGYKQKMGVLVRRMIARLRPSVIIAFDDDAQNFVAKFYVDDPNISVVFSGMNAVPKEYGYDAAKNVTGILERIPVEAVRDTIPYLVKPGLKPSQIKVINLGDQSGTVRLDEKYLLSFNWAPINMIDSVLVDTFEDWKKAVLEASKRADCLFITNYRQLAKVPGGTHFVPPKEVMEWTMKNATIPVLGGNGFVVEDGASLAVAASPYEQGEVAAEMALKILSGMPASQIPLEKTKNFLVFMRGSDPTKFDGRSAKINSRLPKIYEAFARGTGKLY